MLQADKLKYFVRFLVGQQNNLEYFRIAVTAKTQGHHNRHKQVRRRIYPCQTSREENVRDLSRVSLYC